MKWYEKRKAEKSFDSKHCRGGKRKSKRKSVEARRARAMTNNWPRGRS